MPTHTPGAPPLSDLGLPILPIITNFDGTVTTIDNTIYRITNGITNIIISSINNISNSNGRITLLSIV